MALRELIAPRTSIARYIGLMLGGETILSGLAISSLRVDCFRNQYHWVHKVTGRWASILHSIANTSSGIKNHYRRIQKGTGKWAHQFV